jgi:hypothetical protein
MKTRIAATALIAALSQSAFADEPYWNNVDNGFDKMIYAQKDNAAYWDGVQSSFANMLRHEPYAGPTAVTVARGEPDEAEALIHARLRGEQATAYAQKAEPDSDTVTASFGRMLDHTPYAGRTGVTVSRAQDHRVDRLVHALRQEQTQRIRLAAAEQENGSVVK